MPSDSPCVLYSKWVYTTHGNNSQHRRTIMKAIKIHRSLKGWNALRWWSVRVEVTSRRRRCRRWPRSVARDKFRPKPFLLQTLSVSPCLHGNLEQPFSFPQAATAVTLNRSIDRQPAAAAGDHRPLLRVRELVTRHGTWDCSSLETKMEVGDDALKPKPRLAKTAVCVGWFCSWLICNLGCALVAMLSLSRWPVFFRWQRHRAQGLQIVR